MTPRFIMVGGFLGAGKTTTVGRLAKLYSEQGLRVGIVTNDQAADLVDTHSLRSQGFEVGEVAGACFCCNFNELTATVEKIAESMLPDVILAEPVGSCTDLVATVIRPLTHVYQRPFRIAPYGVILKPGHGRRILKGEPTGGFSPKAEYIFRKQLEEADFIIINRIDELPPTGIDELERLLERDYPDRPILRLSARQGTGFEQLQEMLDRDGLFGQRLMELDYDVYAEGEAELGWLNGQVRITAGHPFALDEFLMDLIRGLHGQLIAHPAETAHLKTIGLCDGSYAVANAVSNLTAPELSLPSLTSTLTADVVVNARVAADPVWLEELVRRQLTVSSARIQAVCSIRTLQSFRPGRPVPTHRMI
jgi:Ni2+-binding GTPase involved in maturation of urease and hydrogenase